jgi:GABA permease
VASVAVLLVVFWQRNRWKKGDGEFGVGRVEARPVRR